MKGFAPVIAILIGLGVIAGGTAGLSVAASYSKATPNTALYGLRTAGDAIRCAFSTDRQTCFEQFAVEREQQAQKLQDTQPQLAQKLRDDATSERQMGRPSTTTTQTPSIPTSRP